MPTVKAAWTGVVVVGDIRLDCGLYPATERPVPLPLVEIHNACITQLPLKVAEEGVKPEQAEAEEAGAVEPEPKPEVSIQDIPHCPTCERDLKSDEVGKGVFTSGGLIKLTPTQLETLKFEPTKTINMELVELTEGNKSIINEIGFSRRLYVIAKPKSEEGYREIYTLFRRTPYVGFLPLIVISRKPNVAVMRAARIPKAVFGAEREVLIVDVLNNSATIRDPRSIRGFLDNLKIAELEIKEAITKVEKVARVRNLDPERCIDPARQQLEKIIKTAVTEAMRR